MATRKGVLRSGTDNCSDRNNRGDIRWTTIWSQGLAYTRFTGVITVDDLIAANDEFRNDVRFDGLRVVLHDFLNIDTLLGLSQMTSCIESIWTADHISRQRNPRLQKILVSNNLVVNVFAAEYINRQVQALPLRLYTNLNEAMTAARALTSVKALD